MTALVTTVLLASLVGSAHCAGMCGAIAAFCAGAGECAGRQSAIASMAYHGSRMVSYALVGLLAGGIGSLLDATGALVGLQQVAAVLGGATIAIVGCAVLMRASGIDVGCMQLPQWMKRSLAGTARIASRLPPVRRATLFGLATPLMPCGWLWSFAAVAAGTGDPLTGSAVMCAFWAGSVPMLAIFGAGIAALGGSRRRLLAALAGVAMIGAGIYTAGVRAQFAPQVAKRLADRPGEMVSLEQLERISSVAPPCCSDGGPKP